MKTKTKPQPLTAEWLYLAYHRAMGHSELYGTEFEQLTVARRARWRAFKAKVQRKLRG